LIYPIPYLLSDFVIDSITYTSADIWVAYSLALTNYHVH
jgi:hypothetical protein